MNVYPFIMVVKVNISSVISCRSGWRASGVTHFAPTPFDI